ncbi:hypothetical protein J3R82DRAFT_5886 [Butyriboletus roseoflavus]|nr:hypothetical protein J3R82DRAFT_5886 [Butyriboletus roseoflavus]
MFSYLVVALFALLSLSVSSRPLPRANSSLPPCDLPTSTPSSSPSVPTTSSTASAPASTSTALTAVSAASASGPYTGGVATYFYQNGNPGACGQVNSDSAFIYQTRFGTSGPASPLCGQQVSITNQNNGKSITVQIADDCPTCQNENSIDLSVGAFEALSANDLSIGEFASQSIHQPSRCFILPRLVLAGPQSILAALIHPGGDSPLDLRSPPLANLGTGKEVRHLPSCYLFRYRA